MSVNSRLVTLNAILAAFMVAIGAVGLQGMSGVVGGLKSVYDERTVPLAELGRIKGLLAANFSEALRAIQHNPGAELARLHDHPVSEHTDRIDGNLKLIDELWEKRKAAISTPEERQLAAEFEKKRNLWVGEILKPVAQALKGGNYSTEVVSKFLKGNRLHGQAAAQILDDLMALQLRVAREEYERAQANYSTVRTLAIGSIVGGVGLGLLMALWIIRSITGPLGEMRATIAEVEKNGDFTRRIAVNGDDEVGRTARSFNELMAALQQTLGQVRDSVARVSDAALSVSTSSGQVAGSSSAQSEAASSMSAAVQQMTVSINHVADGARQAVDISRHSGRLSAEGGEVIGQAAAEMSQIADTVRGIAQAIEELGRHSNQISSIVQVIKDVADQTNLLALNAAIEAARAGEQGRGFAVVADEVRKLAERTTKATEEITRMTGAIQCSAQAAVSTMGSAVDQVSGGVALANRAGSAIVQIKDGAEQVVGVVNDISTALAEQTSASDDIANHVERVAKMTEENSTAAAETARAANQLQDLAQGMQAAVSRFRI